MSRILLLLGMIASLIVPAAFIADAAISSSGSATSSSVPPATTSGLGRATSTPAPKELSLSTSQHNTLVDEVNKLTALHLAIAKRSRNGPDPNALGDALSLDEYGFALRSWERNNGFIDPAFDRLDRAAVSFTVALRTLILHRASQSAFTRYVTASKSLQRAMAAAG